MQTSRPISPPVLSTDDPYCLPARWSAEAHEDLVSFLRANAGNAVRISASAVRRLDCLMLQLLLSASRSWTARGLAFALTDRPPHLDAALDLAGVVPSLLHRPA